MQSILRNVEIKENSKIMVPEIMTYFAMEIDSLLEKKKFLVRTDYHKVIVSFYQEIEKLRIQFFFVVPTVSH